MSGRRATETKAAGRSEADDHAYMSRFPDAALASGIIYPSSISDRRAASERKQGVCIQIVDVMLINRIA